jgi:ADP-ribosyl-[dinitrogen reductase] hydrolase
MQPVSSEHRDSFKLEDRYGSAQGRRRPIMTSNQVTRRDRVRGSLQGLAVGDALGTTLEFRSPGTFDPIADMLGGGPFDLHPGEWTDDTSMALCLAESLVETGRFDPVDQLKRYVRWWNEGHMSSNGRCFDIGNTVRAALERFERTGEPWCGSTHEHSAGNGSLMRMAPVPLFFSSDPATAIELAGESSRTTHGAATAIDACRYMSALILGALSGATKEELLAPMFSPLEGHWDEHPLAPEIAEIASGSFLRREPPEIKGSGWVVRSLEAALWAFSRSESFQEGCLLAINLGDDADTTGAIFGQLAGAYYGEQGLPARWRDLLAHRPLIENTADSLHAAGDATS